MGDYEDVLASLETLNHSVLKAMGYTKKVSECGWPLGKWGSRPECWFGYRFSPRHPYPRVPGFVMTSLDGLWGGLCVGLPEGAEIDWEVSRVAL